MIKKRGTMFSAKRSGQQDDRLSQKKRKKWLVGKMPTNHGLV